MEEFSSQELTGRKAQLSEYELTGAMASTGTKQTTLIAVSLLTFSFSLVKTPPYGMALSTSGVDPLTSVNSV